MKCIVLFIVVPLVVVAVISRSGSVPLTITHHPPGIYAAESRDILYSPFDLCIQPMEKLLLVSIEQDPDEIFSGFEPQADH